MYFMAKSCIHTVWPPENDQNVPYLSPLLLASTKFRKIPRKHRNSAATGKFRGSAQNSVCRGKLWSLEMTSQVSDQVGYLLYTKLLYISHDIPTFVTSRLIFTRS